MRSGLGLAFPIALSPGPGVTGSRVIPARVAPITVLPPSQLEGRSCENKQDAGARWREWQEVGRGMGQLRQAPPPPPHGKSPVVPSDQLQFTRPPWRPLSVESPWRTTRSWRPAPEPKAAVQNPPGQLLTCPHGWGKSQVITVLEEPTRK